ncbi:hypothetical protein BSKO_00027 [Bryopsis sp. KO-2023]|nr:hypothetical protein BSKO_00027 [Bryopsis sp. KO-2023]
MGYCCPDFSFRKFVKYAGPSLLMSAAFMDPGNLEGDLQMGAKTGYTLLWVVAVATLLGFIVQYLAAKLGVVTGKGLAEICRSEYPPFVRYTVWIMIELAIIGADVQEVTGSAIALSILSSGYIPLWAGTVIAVATSFGLLFVDNFGPRMLEAVFGVLISVMGLSFLYMYLRASIPVTEVLKGFVIPRMEMSQINLVTGMVGSLIMPFNLYLHSALVLTRSVDRGSIEKKKEAVGYFGLESFLVLLMTLMINSSIVCVFAAGFFGQDMEDVGLLKAADLLADRFGPEMRYVWAIGLVASGQAAVMAGGLAGQHVMLGFLDLRVSKFHRLLFSRSVAIIPTLVVVFLYHESHELDVMNEVLNMFQSWILPFGLIPLLVFTSTVRLMEDMTNSLITSIAAWIIGASVFAFTVAWIFESLVDVCSPGFVGCFFGVCAAASYFGFITYILLLPCIRRGKSKQNKISKDEKIPLISEQEVEENC